MSVLSVRDLHVAFPSEAGRVDAVRGVGFDLAAGRTLGIVGESGSGKSVTSLAVMGLLPDSASVTGSITLGGRDLVGRSDVDMSAIRGREIGMIFQDPLSSLTPIFTVGRPAGRGDADPPRQPTSRPPHWTSPCRPRSSTS